MTNFQVGDKVRVKVYKNGTWEPRLDFKGTIVGFTATGKAQVKDETSNAKPKACNVDKLVLLSK